MKRNVSVYNKPSVYSFNFDSIETDTSYQKNNEIFSTEFFSLKDTSKTATVLPVYNSAKATSDTTPSKEFSKALVSSGGGSVYSLTPAVNGIFTIYVTFTNSDWSKKTQSKAGVLTLGGDFSEAEVFNFVGSNEVAYHVTKEVQAKKTYTFTASSNKSALFGVDFEISAEEPTE